MTHYRGPRTLKIEFGIAIIVLISTVVFSFETKDFFIDNAIQKHYGSLAKFKNIIKNVDKSQKLQVSIEELEEMENSDFILKNDVKLYRAKAYGKIGSNDMSITILNKLVKSTEDDLSKADAILELANVYQKKKNIKLAISTIEDNSGLFKNYRAKEMNFKLFRLYYKITNIGGSGKYLLKTGIVPREYRSLYTVVIKASWSSFTREEKREIINRLYRMKLYKSYTEFVGKYVVEFQPSIDEVGDLTYDLLARRSNQYVADYLSILKSYEKYALVYKEAYDIYRLSKSEISSGSAKARGTYYYRKLRQYKKLRNYSASSVKTYYNNYLDGNIDRKYAGKNIVFTVRNLLAYKKYATITNLIERTYVKLGLTNDWDVLTQYASFWNGYCHLKLGSVVRALQEFENTISIKPDSYYSINARALIIEVLDRRHIALEEYLSSVEYKYISNPNSSSRLHYAKILYNFRKGYGRDILRERIIELTKKIYGSDSFYEFDQSIDKKLKASKEYIRFVAYARFGFVEKAKAVIASTGITDPLHQDFLILKELVKSKQFSKTNPIYIAMKRNTVINNNFTFLSHDIKELYYPQPYEAEIENAIARQKKNYLDKYLVYSIIRGESLYMSHARSHVGAQGLMQLMPRTGRMVAKQVFKKTDIDYYNTMNNIILGTTYLNNGIRAYGLYEAIASYNSGNGIMRKTRRKFHPANELELLEIIPYEETRYYIKKIMNNYYRYKELYKREGVTVKFRHIEISDG